MIRPEEAARPFTVTELAKEIQRELRPLTALLVKGEVSGMKKGTKGHYSFAIKDGQSLINAFIYADDARRVTTLPEDGHVFIFRGRVDYWAQYGTVRFVVDQVEFDDVGKLRARLEELKRRLEAEGAFDPKRKRPLPFLPRAVALLTSPTGAVIHDLQETIWERYPNMGVVVYPVQVQGNAAPGSISRARPGGCGCAGSGWCRRCPRCCARAPSGWRGRGRRLRGSVPCSRSPAARSRCASAVAGSRPWPLPGSTAV